MIYRLAAAEVDTATREIRHAGVVKEAEPKVFDFVAYLIRFRNRIVAKEELLDELWGGRAVSDSVMARAAHAARRLLGDPAAIKTIYGRGYRFVAPLVELDAHSPEERSPSVPEPGAFASTGEHRSLIGRRVELEVASATLERMLRGEPQTLFVTGEAGIGKTALCERLLALSRGRGARALWGKCSEVPGAPAYWPFIQLLREVAAVTPHAAADKLFVEHPEVRELISTFETVAPPPGVDHQQARFRLFDAIARFLRDASRREPLVLLIDDLHCADTPSLLLCHFLVHHLTGARVLLVAAYRDAEMRGSAEGQRFTRDVARLPGVLVSQLTGLGRDEVDDFIRCATGEAPTPADLDYLVEQTAGNPFYLSQLAPLLGRSTGAGGRRAERASEPVLPRSVLEAIESHLGSLSVETRRTLDAAAVLGRDFDLGILATVLEVEKPEVLAILEVPLDSALLEEHSAASFRFAHVLIRDVLYRALAAPTRSDLHRRAGEALERIMRGKSELVASALAYHFTEAVGPKSLQKAIRYSALAGDLALERLAYEQAAAEFEAAVRLLGPVSEEGDLPLCELLLKLGAAQTRSGDRDSARATFRRAANIARSIHVPERLAEVALDLAPGFFSVETGVVDEDVVARLEEAIIALGEADPLLRARLLSRLAIALYWTDQEERRKALCEEVSAIARATGSPEARLSELGARHAAVWTPENLADRLRWSSEATGLAERLGDLDAELVSRTFRIVDLLQAGEIHALLDEIAAFKRIAVAARQPECLWMADMYDAMLALVRGDFADVERFGMQSIAVGERLGHHNASQSGGLYLTLASLELGRAREVLPALEPYVERYPNVPWSGLLAFVSARAGDRAGTRRLFDRAMPVALSPSRDNLWFATMVELCESAVFLGAKDEAAVLHAELAPFSGMHAVIGYGAATYGAIDRYLGQLSLVLENHTDAISRLEAGIDQNLKLGAEPFVAHGRRELSMALLRRGAPGDRHRADLLVRESTKTAERLGMVWLLARLRGEPPG